MDCVGGAGKRNMQGRGNHGQSRGTKQSRSVNRCRVKTNRVQACGKYAQGPDGQWGLSLFQSLVSRGAWSNCSKMRQP